MYILPSAFCQDTSSKRVLKEFEGFMTLAIPNDADEFKKLKTFVVAMHGRKHTNKHVSHDPKYFYSPELV